MLDSDKDEAYPPTHKAYWNAADAYLMGNVTPGGVFCATPHTKKKPKKKIHTNSKNASRSCGVAL